MDLRTKKLAVLIDADNSSASSISLILEEIAKYGIASVKRVYGDWSSEMLNEWRDISVSHAITPVQQLAYNTGKHAADMGLVIDAMDLLYSAVLDGFCIISSDSGFTPLASRIRESGLIVYGIGTKQTPEAFFKACDRFIYVENLFRNEKSIIENKIISDHKENIKGPKTIALEKNVTLDVDEVTLNLIYKALQNNSDESGWANLSKVDRYIRMLCPDFDSRNYGCAKLSDLIEMLNLFDKKIEGSQIFFNKRNQFD